MEQTALRPKPMPGQEPGDGRRGGSASRRPHAARRRGRRLTTLLFGLFVGTVLVLSGVGLGTVGATVIGMSKLADLQQQAGRSAPPGGALPQPSSATRSGSGGGSSTPTGMRSKEAAGAGAGATLGVEVVDAPSGKGALLIGVRVPGPGYSAGVVRGDVLLALGGTRVDSAADLARAVADARPGTSVALSVRHANGNRQQLSVVPGIAT
ncbi:PDZ domain-containing protein [Streptomyces sp. SAS_270]|uniref:PDZ domain-containing protein n=1 Tax=Streptomyces sp. SAS_270 TaxID=3412748 RepID=UPI00403C068F